MVEKITIPEHCNLFELIDILIHVIGGDWETPPTHIEFNYTVVFCIRGSEIKDWSTIKGSTASIRKFKESSFSNRKLQLKDIILEISGGGPDQPVGRTVLIDKFLLSHKPEIPKVCTNFLRLLKFTDSIDNVFVQHFFQFFYSPGKIVNYKSGSNLRNLKFTEFSRIKIPVPSYSEQENIVQKIEKFLKLLNREKSISKTLNSNFIVNQYFKSIYRSTN